MIEVMGRLAELEYALETGDDPDEPHDHGSDKSNKLWTRAAFRSGSPGSCNTWKAPAGRVS
ncbi:hypothetical protein F1D05_25765 [Kribbella qitaiheensis]|uniref:Uncharacterized protein n=1 Tax=Kribbella qitaiheensis TaxID=1544730 RepID=A0A7G6X381_9ACTN|nr:hypothetical protein [Kribbella qitaiheensis]QNE20696.1 hypothetical protein F1D05_25765 [Kribbella qitaiheensis]